MAHPAESTSPFSGSEGRSIAQLKTADDLTKHIENLRRGRQMLDNQWKLNLAFYKGRQYTYINRASRRLESLPVEDGEKPRYLVRLVSNQIVTGAHSLLAKYTKTKPVMSATPGGSGDADLKAAQMAESLLEYWWSDFALDDKLEEALLWSIIAGQGYWKITWDPHAGKAMKFLLDPQGNPIVDDSLKDLFRSQLQKQNIQPQEKTVYLGDIKIEVPSPFDVYVDPAVKVFEDAKYAICVHNLDPDEIHARWNVWVQPDKVTSTPDSTLPFSNASDAGPSNVKAVNVGYFRPNPSLPNGRYVVWMDKPSQILEDGPWPYPFTDLPIVKFPGIRIPGSVYDSSVVEHAIPLQKELNRTISQIVQYKNLTIKPRIWSPAGALSGTRLTDEAGAIWEYNPVGDNKPEAERMPAMPPYIFDHLTGIRNSLREVFGLTEVSEGNLPPNLEAGVAIDLLQEMATDRLAPTIKLIEMAIGRAGEIMLNLGQKYYIEPRLLKIRGSGGSIQVKRFSQADIEGSIDVKVDVGSALPRTRAGRQARIQWMIENQLISPDQGWKYLDIADLKGVGAKLQAAEDQALREQDKLTEGDFIINQVAYEQALSQVESGQAKDQQGQPIQDPQAAQDFLRHAGLQPQPFENYQTHLDAHALWMMSPDWEALPIPIQQAGIDHFTSTLQVMMNLPKPVEFKPVNPSLQIKATAGPTAVSDILNKAGILDVTPEVMAEPPLDTWVSDALDKANEGTSGNSGPAQGAQAAQGTIDAQAGLQKMDQANNEHDLQMQTRAALDAMKIEHQRALADAAKVDVANSVAVAQEKVRAERAKADLAERTAREKRVNPPRPRNNANKQK